MEVSTSAAAANFPSPSSSGKRPAAAVATTLRLLCPSARAAAICHIGNLHVDQPPVGDDAVLSVSGDGAAGVAVRAWERVVGHRVGGEDGEGEGEEEEREVAGVVGCRMLLAGGQVGCVLGKGGKTVERMRQESGAQIRVFRSKDQVPPCAAPGDELIHISGSFSAVRKALLLVSSCLQDNPRPDISNTPTARSFGPPAFGIGAPPTTDPYSQRSYLPSPHMPDYHARSYPSSNVAASSPRFFVEQEVSFRMLCLSDRVGIIIGKGGVTIRALQSETGALIKIADPVAESDERVVMICALENSEMMHSPAQDAVLRVHSRIWEAGVDRSSAVSARLLVPSQQIGCLLGKGGSIISEMRKVTGASIRIFVKEQIPKCAQPNDELVQVTGSFPSVQDALLHITGRIRDTIIPVKPHPSGGMPPYPSAGDAPFHRSRQEPAPPGPYPRGVHSFRADPPILASDMGDRQPPSSYSMEHPGVDRPSYSYGCESIGPQPLVDQPPPRAWAPEVANCGTPRNMLDVPPSLDFRKGAGASENQRAAPTSMTTEVIIPSKYLGFISGANGSDLAEIRKMSGAAITIQDPKTGETAGTVIICGDPNQTRMAQSLLHAFIFCGLYLT